MICSISHSYFCNNMARSFSYNRNIMCQLKDLRRGVSSVLLWSYALFLSLGIKASKGRGNFDTSLEVLYLICLTFYCQAFS